LISASNFSCFLVTEVVHKNMHMPIFIFPSRSQRLAARPRGVQCHSGHTKSEYLVKPDRKSMRLPM
jgi:hypothetical protein